MRYFICQLLAFHRRYPDLIWLLLLDVVLAVMI